MNRCTPYNRADRRGDRGCNPFSPAIAIRLLELDRCTLARTRGDRGWNPTSPFTPSLTL